MSSFDSTLTMTLDQMLRTMYLEKGIGLAAPQVGLLINVLVADWDSRIGPVEMVNPRVVSSSGEIRMSEGCLSVPGVTVRVKRAKKLDIAFQDRHGLLQNMSLSGLGAVVIQHELDHLRGRTILDNLDRAQRRRYLKFARKRRTIP